MVNLFLTHFKPTKQEVLSLWLKRQKLTFADVGKELNVTGSNARKLLYGETAPTHRVKALKEIGIPEALLPIAKDIPPGPKPSCENRIK